MVHPLYSCRQQQQQQQRRLRRLRRHTTKHKQLTVAVLFEIIYIIYVNVLHSSIAALCFMLLIHRQLVCTCTWLVHATMPMLQDCCNFNKFKLAADDFKR